MNRTWTALATLALAAACKPTEPTEPTADGGAAVPAPDPVDPPAATPMDAPRVLVENVGFKTPESAQYDPFTDVYLVSNINGKPTAADGNGFISKVHPQGHVIALKWIDGARPDVTLNAPKGMAVSGDLLYVADITVVRKFDRRTGKPIGELAFEGATFINGLAVAPDGTLYVADSGLDASFKPTGTDAVYRVDESGETEPIIKGKDLGQPNGLVVTDAGVWVCTWGSGELFRIDGGKKVDAVKLPKGQLDGLVAVGDDLVVSSWEGKTVYRRDGSAFADLVTDVTAPADLGFDVKRNRILIPLFQSNAVDIRAL